MRHVRASRREEKSRDRRDLRPQHENARKNDGADTNACDDPLASREREATACGRE